MRYQTYAGFSMDEAPSVQPILPMRMITTKCTVPLPFRLQARLSWVGCDFLGGHPYVRGMSMTGIGSHRLFWYCALAAGLALGTMPLFTQAVAFRLPEMLGGTILTIVSLIYLRKPRRVRLRLPYRRTLS